MYGNKWKVISQEFFNGERTHHMCRNRVYRRTKAGLGKHKCSLCGDLRKGHICRMKANIGKFEARASGVPKEAQRRTLLTQRPSLIKRPRKVDNSESETDDDDLELAMALSLSLKPIGEL